jgi:hypothetical protein
VRPDPAVSAASPGDRGSKVPGGRLDVRARLARREPGELVGLEAGRARVGRRASMERLEKQARQEQPARPESQAPRGPLVPKGRSGRLGARAQQELRAPPGFRADSDPLA